MFKRAKDIIKQTLHLKKDLQHYADCIIRNENGDLLLLRRSYQDDFEGGKWCLPGGKIEAGEVPEYAAARELFEETGLQTELEFIQAVERKDSISLYFQGYIHSSEFFPILDNEEHYAVEWVPINRIAKYDLLLDLKDILMNKIKLPIYSTKLMQLDIYDANDLFKRIEYVEKSFDNEEMSVEEYFHCKETIQRHLNKIIEIGLEKGLLDELIKGGRRAVIGEIRTFGGRDFIRTKEGWKYYGKGTGKVATKHKESTSTSKKTLEGSTITLDDLMMDSAVSAGGSGGAYIVRAKNGKRYIVKEEGGDPSHERKNTADQLKSEALVDKLYNLLSIKASKSILLEKGDGKVVKVSEFLDNAKNLGSVYDDYEKGSITRDQIDESIKKGFLADCLFLNWDVVGASKDNMVVFDNLTTGKIEVHRIDNGGALMYRAKMGKKSSDKFSSDIKELSTMLSSTNPSAAEVFGNISHAELVEQAKNIVENKEKILDAIKNASLEDSSFLHDAIEKRIDWIKGMYLDEKTKEATFSVTEEYEKRLMASDFTGNPGIKEAIMKQIKRVEKNQELYIEIHATKRGISAEAYKKLCQDHIEKLMSSAQLFRATDIDILDYVLPAEGGRFKSQFETGVSHGALSPSARTRAENEYFGFGPATDRKEMRPIYGYTTDNKNGVQNYKGDHPPSNGASSYGGVTVKMKEEVKNRATFCFGDSLGIADERACTPITHPHFTSFDFRRTDPLDRYNSLSKLDGHSYVEVQYHNQLKSSDIESIHVSPFVHEETPSESSYERINNIISIAHKHNIKAIVYGKS